MLARIFLAIVWLGSIDALAADLSKEIKPFSEENKKIKNNAIALIETVINKKTRDELSPEEEEFINSHKIDLSKSIKSICFCIVKKDDNTGAVIGRNVFDVSYFSEIFDKDLLVSESFEEWFHHHAGIKYENYIGFTFAVKKPVTPVMQKNDTYVKEPISIQPRHHIPKVIEGPAQFQNENGKIIRLENDQVLIDDAIYTCEEASKILGRKIKPLNVKINFTHEKN